MHNLVTWLVEDKVALTSIIGELGVKDLPELDRQVIALFEKSSSTEIHVVADIERMTAMPSIFQMTKLTYVTHPQMGYFVTQSRNRFEVFIGDTVGKLLKTKYQFVKSLEDGLVFLKNTDENLPPVAEMNGKLEKILADFS